MRGHGGRRAARRELLADYFARWCILQQLPLQQGPPGQQFFAAAKPVPMVMAANAAMLRTTFVILFIAILLFDFTCSF